jgi:hypothetical protein
VDLFHLSDQQAHTWDYALHGGETTETLQVTNTPAFVSGGLISSATGYSALRNVQRATATKETTATWTMAQGTGGLVTTLLRSPIETQIFTARAPGLASYETFPFFLARRKSVFTTFQVIHEPFAAAPFLKARSWEASTRQSALEVWSPRTRDLVFVTHVTAATQLPFTNPAQAKEEVTLSGPFAFVRISGNRVTVVGDIGFARIGAPAGQSTMKLRRNGKDSTLVVENGWIVLSGS